MEKFIGIGDPNPYWVTRLSEPLEGAGYKVLTANTIADTFGYLKSFRVPVLILDPEINSPDSGIDTIANMRIEHPLVSVLAVSQSEDSLYKADILDAGADDYLTKVDLDGSELAVRVAGLLRRPHRGSPLLTSGNLSLDLDTHEVTKAGEPIHTPPISFRLLAYFMENKGRIQSPTEILLAVWGPRYEHSSPNLVAQNVQELRGITEEDRHDPKRLVSVRGFGYIFKG